ncbi:hypothetical protein Cni_G14796 [Canna indica]|uniref:Protein SHORTAGE IN CHIASMATA 1 n=1 Tax=Canna indica TaxID=4628 RepID=A0AAQ3KDG7_9LILI|nr:hypothetical protein Cni_G14796 [Canna indica]
MRSRFLNTDYFSFSSRSQIETLSRFQVLPLPPPPHLSPTVPSSIVEIPLPNTDLDLRVPFELDPFPIENALSQFLSDVIPKTQAAAEEGSSLRIGPRKQQFDSVSREIYDIEKGGAGFYVVEGPERSVALDASISDVTAMLIHAEKDADEDLDLRYNGFLAKNSLGYELHKELAFELVEVDLPLIKTRSSLVRLLTLSFSPVINSFRADSMDIDVDVKVIYPHKVAKSTYLVDEIHNKFDELEVSCLKTTSSFTDRTMEHKLVLPQFEVNENYLDPQAGISNAEALSCLHSIIQSCPGLRVDESVLNANEFLECNSIDIMGDFSGDSLMDYSPEEKPLSLSFILEMDILNLGDIMLLERGSAIYAIASDEGCPHLPCSVHFQEVQNFDFPSEDVLQIVVSSQQAKSFDMTDLMVVNEMEVTGLYQSFVSTELALVDDTFKSLPAPFLFDDKAMKSTNMVVEELLQSLEPYSSSACDDIYLDWHLVLEGICNREICFSYMNMLHNVSTCETTSYLQTDCEEIVSIDIDFFDDFPQNVDMLESKELPKELCRSAQHVTYLSANAKTSQLKNNGILNAERNQIIISEKSSFLFESMSQSNDLNFFLDVRRGTSMEKRSDKQISPPVPVYQESPFPCDVQKDNSARWVIDVRSVILSENILGLMQDIHKTYLAILEESSYLKKNLQQITDNPETLSISKQKLLHLISDRFAKQYISDSCDKDVMTFIALYCLKQLAYFLCFFGVHVAHLYISYSVRSINSIAERLRSLEALLEDVCWKSEKQLVESHPSLSVIEEILIPNIQNANKILIIAEKVFWLPLTQKLTSMRIKFHPLMVDHVPTNNLDKIDNITYEASVLEWLQHSDCLLASYENVSASFPFNKFGIILEYGGPYASSRLSSVSPNSDGYPRVHFIHVEFESHLIAIALCEGPDACKLPEPTREGTSQFIPSVQKSLSNIIEVLNFVPTEKNKGFLSYKYVNHMESSHENECESIPCLARSNDVDQRESCSPDVVVIVNTQNFEKKMLISRRTSYQKILAMEKRGVQVVERDVDLPLDLIFNAAVCLIWYEARNFMVMKATRTEDSYITMFVENIATNILMSLSYSFSTCILIFEGETSFLSAIMESSDVLYAAAAGLDMNLQLFCSYEPDSTDDIILSCIKAATRSTRGLYPAMPESESIGESFLTRFPSINPLSAHAILSSGGSLVEFLEWSNERRIQVVGKYLVPRESVSLFGVLCKYGEVGESKSVMTECSSIDSDINSGLLPSPRKRQKHAYHSLPMLTDDPLLAKPLNQNIRLTEKPPTFQQHQLRNFSSIQEKMRKIDSNYYNMSGKRSSGTTVSVHDLNHTFECNYANTDFISEINNHDCNIFDENPFASDTFNFLEAQKTVSEPTIRSLHATSRQAPHTKNHSMFLTSGGINHDSKNNSLNGHYPSSSDGIFKYGNIHSNKDDGLVIDQDHFCKNFLQDSQEFQTNSFSSSAKENVPPAYGGNSFSNTTQPSRLQRHGWFTDFLHRLKEKGNKQQQTLPRNPCFNCTRFSNVKNTPSTSQSPSIIDTYRYQSSNQTNNTAKRKGKRVVKRQVNSSAREWKDSSLIARTWTPIDKRARQVMATECYC